MDIRTYLNEQPLLFDGAMGTYYAARNRHGADTCEQANITAPAEILAIHREYLAAGCRAIKTNTFGVNRPAVGEAACTALLEAGYRLAAEAAGETAFVFADIGPIDLPDSKNLFAEYQFLVDRFLALGAEHFLFETHSPPWPPILKPNARRRLSWYPLLLSPTASLAPAFRCGSWFCGPSRMHILTP